MTSAARAKRRSPSEAVADRVAGIGWERAESDLDAQGWAVLPKLLQAEECERTSRLYDEDPLFRSRIVMARHGFGQGEYKYFAYPLPPLVAELRESLYPHLAPIANRWHEAMGLPVRFPAKHAEFVKRCHAAGQTRPT
ncbi:MAG: proline hydroxylase, partial [Rhodospirillales bacterium]|nr:proline hydroxylase [Rhodospirillales bacterium]